MKATLKGIAAGLSAMGKSLTEDRCHYRVGDARITCPICGYDEFDQRSMLMNTSGMTFMNLDWLNDNACVLVCRSCTRIELFARAPEYDD